MPSLKDLTNVWNNIKEIDVRPIARDAERSVHLAIAGLSQESVTKLANYLRRDPHNPIARVESPIITAGLDDLPDAAAVDLLFLILESSTPDDSLERQAAQKWSAKGKPVLVLLNSPAPYHAREAVPPELKHWVDWGKRSVVIGPLDDEHFLLDKLAPTAVRLLPDCLLALGRTYPLFRSAVANHLINETCFSNAAYALSTGIAEVVPVFDIPITITDLVVLTKAQAFLVYKLGLSLGMSERWQDYLGEFGSVLGGGFVWRQLARQLVGLIPVWGIVPKVAVSYAGTYVVGHVVLQWYLTGRHLSARQMHQLYGQAFAHGRQLAGRIFKDRLPARKAKVH